MHELNGRRIALIGGAGFVGHHLALRLKELGNEVIVIDNLMVNNLGSFIDNRSVHPDPSTALAFVHSRLLLMREKEVLLIVIDARDRQKLSAVLDETQPDAVIHLAAVANVKQSRNDPRATFDHSIISLENALECARSSVRELKHFVFFSSSMVYGHFTSACVTEEFPCKPVEIYGALKLAAENMVIGYGQAFDIPYTVVRPSALYGPRCVSRRVGQILVENVIRDRAVTLYGDGSERLDFTHINDLVSGIVACLMHEKAKGQIFNLSYGEAHSIAEMVDILKARFSDVRVTYKAKDSYNPKRGTLCVDKARTLLGYNPQYHLEKGYLDYIRWYESVIESGCFEVRSTLKSCKKRW